MDMKKSNFIEDYFKLSSFSKKVDNGNAGKVIALLWVLSTQVWKPTI